MAPQGRKLQAMIFPEMCCRNTTRRVTLRALVEHETRLWRRARWTGAPPPWSGPGHVPAARAGAAEQVKIDRIVENLDPVIRYVVADQSVPAAFVHRVVTTDARGTEGLPTTLSLNAAKGAQILRSLGWP
jgi:hypothetical protein